MIQSFPSFKKNNKIIGSEVLDNAVGGMDVILDKVYEAEKHVFSTIDKVQMQFKELISSIKDLRVGIKKLKAIELVANNYNLGYGEELSDSYPTMAAFVEQINERMKNFEDFFNSDFFKNFNYLSIQYKTFQPYLLKNKSYIDYVKGLKAGLNQKDENKSVKANDIDIFKSYLTHITHYNFKYLYILKNKKLNESFYKIMNTQAGYCEKVR